MYFEASLHGLKFKASGGLGGWGGAAPHGLKMRLGWGPICKQNARMMGFESTLSLKQACAAQKKSAGMGRLFFPACSFLFFR